MTLFYNFYNLPSPETIFFLVRFFTSRHAVALWGENLHQPTQTSTWPTGKNRLSSNARHAPFYNILLFRWHIWTMGKIRDGVSSFNSHPQLTSPPYQTETHSPSSAGPLPGHHSLLHWGEGWLQNISQKGTVSKLLYAHFAQHHISSFSLCGLETNASWTLVQRRAAERKWIFRLSSTAPLGLNDDGPRPPP